MQRGADRERQRWLALLIVNNSGSGSWQEKDFGLWVNLFTGNHYPTKEEATEEMMTILKQSVPEDQE